MPYRFSNCICLQLPQMEEAREFYEKVMGLPVAGEDGESVELEAEQNRLFLDKGEHLGPILEFLVPDLETAREELLNQGCEVIKWEGRDGCCYLRDPFGFAFNLYEEPNAIG